MNKVCISCSKEGIYKCPTCLVFYCSAICCKKHRETKCDVLKTCDTKVRESESTTQAAHRTPVKRKLTEDEVPIEELQKLANNKELKTLLTNPHLQNLLQVIDKSDDDQVETVMQKAMQEPIFVEFADECLKVVQEKESGT